MSMELFTQGLIFGFAIAAPVGPIGILTIRRTLVGGLILGLLSEQSFTLRNDRRCCVELPSWSFRFHVLATYRNVHRCRRIGLKIYRLTIKGEEQSLLMLSTFAFSGIQVTVPDSNTHSL